jgi:hypothetical protein
MENIIKTEGGFFTIVERYGKDFIIEMFDPNKDNPNVLYVQYSSDYFILRDEEKVKNILKELEPQIIQIMKFLVNENFEFYKHFNLNYTLNNDHANLTPTEIDNNNFFHISWDWFLKAELKSESLRYLKSLTDEQKRIANGLS